MHLHARVVCWSTGCVVCLLHSWVVSCRLNQQQTSDARIVSGSGCRVLLASRDLHTSRVLVYGCACTGSRTYTARALLDYRGQRLSWWWCDVASDVDGLLVCRADPVIWVCDLSAIIRHCSMRQSVACVWTCVNKRALVCACACACKDLCLLVPLCVCIHV